MLSFLLARPVELGHYHQLLHQDPFLSFELLQYFCSLVLHLHYARSCAFTCHPALQLSNAVGNDMLISLSIYLRIEDM